MTRGQVAGVYVQSEDQAEKIENNKSQKYAIKIRKSYLPNLTLQSSLLYFFSHIFQHGTT